MEEVTIKLHCISRDCKLAASLSSVQHLEMAVNTCDYTLTPHTNLLQTDANLFEELNEMKNDEVPDAKLRPVFKEWALETNFDPKQIYTVAAKFGI